jgi:hypothetical protein
VYGYELTLQVGAELSDLHPAGLYPSPQIIAVGFAAGCFFQVDQARIPGRDLNPFIAERSGPSANTFKRIEGGGIAHELGEENGRTLHMAGEWLNVNPP